MAHYPRPVVSINENSKILIIGQAPGRKVHESGIPWDDASGNQLRKWLNVDRDLFYSTELFGIVPMGFCFPGSGKSGDLPPRKECAENWHFPIMSSLKNVQLTLLIGQYAQKYYLKEQFRDNLTSTVKSYLDFLPEFIPLPHPSPRNRYWLSQNPWFEDEIIGELRNRVHNILNSKKGI